MLGIFGIFGRSQDIQRLDRAFRSFGLHPRLVADAVKIATVKQLKDANRIADLEYAAELLTYCALGAEEFTDNNGAERTQAVEARLIRAIEDERGFDARLVLLALHARLAHPSVIDRFDLESA
jgi:hypothetical protein